MIKSYTNFITDSIRHFDWRMISQSLRDKGESLSPKEREILDNACRREGMCDKIEGWLSGKFEMLKTISLIDIQDRLVEFSDEIHNPIMAMLSISAENSTIGINEKKLDDQTYFNKTLGAIILYIISDSTSKSIWSKKITVDDWLNNYKCAIYIDIKWMDKSPTNLNYLESFADRVIKRLRDIYSIESIDYRDYPRVGRKYDTNIDVQDYSFVLYFE